MTFGALWLGERCGGTISIDPFTQDKIYIGFSLNNLHVIDNVTRISRLLIRYQLYTALVADDVDGDRIPWPVDVGVEYTPSPDGEFFWQPGELGGGASWRETVKWTAQSVARTGVPSTMYSAYPEQPRSSQAQRIIHDKSTALLTLGFGYIPADSTSGIITPAYIPTAVTGWVQVDYLLSNAEL
jgi:hypothetical protein